MRKHSGGAGLGLLIVLQAAGVAPLAASPDAGRPPSTQPAAPRHPGIPSRDPKADPHQIDLTNYYTLALTEDASGAFGYTLDMLPRGIKQLGDVCYDLRGVVQVSGKAFGGKNFPEAVKGIPVGLTCRRLMFLHASRWSDEKGRKIGRYVIHYANAQTQEVPIIFGADVRDWRDGPVSGDGGPAPAWQGNDKAPNDVALFETAWTNPLPSAQIESIDMVSAMTDAAPFLVAVTAQ